MPDAQATGAATETAIGDERTLLAQVHALDIRCGIEHLLHAGAALGPLVGDDDAVALLHLPAKDALAGVLLRVEHHGRPFEVPQCLVDAGGLDHAAVLGDVAEEHGQSTVLGVGMLHVAYAAIRAVLVE